MKRSLILLGLLIPFLKIPPSYAGLRFGLGEAVAKRSAELIEKAAANDPANAVGDAVAATLASCPSGAVYDTTPTDLSMIGGIDPLGHVAPSGHTFPSDHIYFYSSTSTAYTPPVYAPGAIHVTSIAKSEYLSATPSYTDYSVYFYGCRELKSYFFHVRTLSPSLQTRMGEIDQNCSSYSTGGATIRRCDKSGNVTMAAGDLIGYGATSGAFDFGSYDYRITPLSFISPSRHYSDRAYTVCPIDYFTEGPKASMEALLGRFDGGYRRVVAPVCGQINFDLAGTARGHWYHVGSADSPEDPHLALIVNNVYAPQQTLSYGTSLPNASANFYTFIPASSGQVNRDMAQVTADGQIYCYESFFDPLGQSISSGPTFLIQMTSTTTLQFERQSATTCGAGPWAFTSNAANFQR